MGQIDKTPARTVRGSRNLFADDITSGFFVTASGGEDALVAVHSDIPAAITALMRFGNVAIEQWLLDAQERGAKFFNVGEGPLQWPESSSE